MHTTMHTTIYTLVHKPVPTITAVGVASPKAQGHDMTITDVAESSANKNGSSLHCCTESESKLSQAVDSKLEEDAQMKYHPKKVTNAIVNTVGAKMPAILSASLTFQNT